MKLLMVTHYFASRQGGIELVAGNLFRGIASGRCEVAWAAADVSAPPAEIPYGRVLPLRTWSGVERMLGVPFPVPSITALRTLRSAVGQADVVLLHDCLYLNNIAAFLFARLRGVPVMIVQHIGIVPYDSFMRRSLMRLANAIFTRPMLRRAEQVVFVSQITKRHFGGVGFSQPPVVIFNGVDTQIFTPVKDDSAKFALRTRLGLPPEGQVALFVGRFVEKKGLRVMNRIVGSAPEITWAFAGSGPLNPEQWNLVNVKVYRELHHNQLADVYRASDVFVLPSTGEGFPLVVQEALASGLPVVCSAETATADEALAPFVLGIPLVGGDAQAAKEFLSAIYQVLSEKPSKGVAPLRFRFVRDRYSWTRATNAYYDIASKLAKDSDGHADPGL
jgi:glycosyltransferase involved in cell wall biosynthesis